MIILHSKNTIFMRVPKTGSTSLEAVVRMSCPLADGDFCSNVEDANIPEVVPQVYSSMRASVRSKFSSIREKRSVERNTGEPATFTDEEQELISQRQSNEFRLIGLHHATLDNLVDPVGLADAQFATEEQILSYTNYAVIRNPLARAVSSYVFSSTRGRPSFVQGLNVTIEEFHKSVRAAGYSLVNRRQIDYFKFQGQTHHNGERIVTPILFEKYKEGIDSALLSMDLQTLTVYPKFKDSARFTDLTDPEGQIPSKELWIDPYPEIRDILLDFYAEDVALWEEVSGQSI